MMEGRPVSRSRLESRIRPQPREANNGGVMHGGHILFHLDTYCGMAAGRHAGTRVVTVSVDRMDFLRPVLLGYNLIFKTCVNMARGKSMEVGARLELEDSRTLEVTHVGSAYLTFVPIGENGRPTAVPPLIAETDEDRRRMADAARRAYLRRMERVQARGRVGALCLELLAEPFFVCRFAPGVIPPPLPPGSLSLCAVTDTETTLMFPDSPEATPLVESLCSLAGARLEKGWRAFVARDVPGLPAGGSAALCAVLAAENIAARYMSTFSSGYLLVRGDAVPAATEALCLAGYTVTAETAPNMPDQMLL